MSKRRILEPRNKLLVAWLYSVHSSLDTETIEGELLAEC
jgi:hypothetical protein